MLAKILLVAGVSGMAGGIVIDCRNAFNIPELSAVLPLGTIALGAFFIMFILQNEMAKYDEEQRSKLPPEPKKTAGVAPGPEIISSPSVAGLKGKTI